MGFHSAWAVICLEYPEEESDLGETGKYIHDSQRSVLYAEGGGV